MIIYNIYIKLNYMKYSDSNYELNTTTLLSYSLVFCALRFGMIQKNDSKALKISYKYKFP